MDEEGTIVPEYLPPSGASTQASANIIGSTKSFAALLVDLAVRHYIKIIQTREKSFWHKAEYKIEVIRSVQDLHDEEQEVLRDLFNHLPNIGESREMKKLQGSAAIYRLNDNAKKLQKLERGKYGLRTQVPEQSAWFKKAGKGLMLASVPLLSLPLFIAGAVSMGQGHYLWPLTDKGLDLLRYLKGLKMYIGVAETERLKMLQSPEGAEKVGDTTDGEKLVKLYERVLPYAVLFGQEKE